MNHRIVKETLKYYDGTKDITYYIERKDENEWHRISPKFVDLKTCRKAVKEYILPEITIEVIENV